MVGRIVVVRRDGHGHAGRLCRGKQALDIGHGVVGLDRRADHAPGHAVGAEEIDLGIGDDQRRIGEVHRHGGLGQGRLGRIGVGVVRQRGACHQDRGSGGVQKVV